jgi:hypothetical protein
MAFESRQLAGLVILFNGIRANVFLLPETQLSSQLLAKVAQQRVVVFRTAADYNGATSNDPGFPWPDRTICYDIASAFAHGSAE